LYKNSELEIQEPILHFAAEPCLSKVFNRDFNDYKQVGLQGPDLKLDIENISVDSESIGTVIAHHVLEHVNDRKALAEIWRILKVGGFFYFSVPIVANWENTFEDLGCSDKSQRQLYFGQHDHLRIYGRDIFDRANAAGFTVREFIATEPTVSKYGIERGDTIFICTK